MYNGYTRDLGLDEQARNIAARLAKCVGADESKRVALDLLRQHGYVSPEYVRDLDAEARWYEDELRDADLGSRFIVFGGDVLELPRVDIVSGDE